MLDETPADVRSLRPAGPRRLARRLHRLPGWRRRLLRPPALLARSRPLVRALDSATAEIGDGHEEPALAPPRAGRARRAGRWHRPRRCRPAGPRRPAELYRRRRLLPHGRPESMVAGHAQLPGGGRRVLLDRAARARGAPGPAC